MKRLGSLCHLAINIDGPTLCGRFNVPYVTESVAQFKVEHRCPACAQRLSFRERAAKLAERVKQRNPHPRTPFLRCVLPNAS